MCGFLFKLKNSRIFKRNFASKKAFSLVEIMIVLAIIGSIIGMIATRIVGAQQRAKQKEARIAMDGIANGLSMYFNDCSKYPKSLQGLTQADADCPQWADAYYKGKLTDPWNNPYEYENTGNDFTLKSTGKDGRPGGTGLDRDIAYGEEIQGSTNTN